MRYKKEKPAEAGLQLLSTAILVNRPQQTPFWAVALQKYEQFLKLQKEIPDKQIKKMKKQQDYDEFE